MTVDQIEENLKTLFKLQLSEETFIFDFLLSYGFPKSSISRLKKGDYNLSKNPGEILWKKKVFFKTEKKIDLHNLIDNLRNDDRIIKSCPRFIIVTDFKILLSIDRNIDDYLDISLKDMPRYFDFFLPLAGIEKVQLQRENLADRKAAEKLARLYDLILEDNSLENPKAIHLLNVFLSRLLFCFFAEDTGIFPRNKFTNSIMSHTAEDGSDLNNYLDKFFSVLNEKERSPQMSEFLKVFPYVNGGLFKEKIPIPKFSKKSRRIIIECGSLNWKEINPDIFGSMIQAVVHHSQRGGGSSLGIHYTSVENIMKVINPLFLSDLYDEFKKAGDNKKKLNNLLRCLYTLKIFDPACGSGNFLIITYKELCRLEMEIFKKLHDQQMRLQFSGINLNQFYGIEIDDFAHETAKLSLYIAEHQINLEFKEVFGETKSTLPLGKGGNIICGNATRFEWEKICPEDKNSKIYILGNPPYLGSKYQSKEQKSDLKEVAKELDQYKNLDYISCWFIKAGKYIASSVDTFFGFVSTNSICQGRQVELLWPHLLNKNLEIFFAHKSFRWTNNARGGAGVSCIIVGLRKTSNKPKYLYNSSVRKVKNINAYLIPSDNIIISKRMSQLSKIPSICMGSSLNDDGNLTLNDKEKKDFIKSFPKAQKFILNLIGSDELIKGKNKFCIWVNSEGKDEALEIPVIKKRVDSVKKYRLNKT